MNRREFLQAGAASSGLVLSGTGEPASAAAFTAPETKRVGLIGCGWYGKTDLLRLIQVAPVEVVSLCDVDKKMLAEAAEIVATRQASKKTPRTYADYREMLKEKDLDIVLIATPDHWHALPMIAAVEAGADVYVQKPISVDVTEGQAMLAAARKHQRVVQVGTQRRSTPHLIEARDRIIREGKLGKIGLVEIYCYYHMRDSRQPARHQPARLSRLGDVDRPGPHAAVQPDRPPPRLARVHGVRQRHHGRHVHPHARHGALDARAGLAEADQLDGRHPGRQREQGEHPRHADGHVRLRRPDGRLAASHLGRPGRPEVPLGRDVLRRQGDAEGERHRLRLHPAWAAARRSTATSRTSSSEYPEDKTEKDLEKHVAPAIRGHMKDFLAAIASRGTSGGRHRGRLHLDDELHPGQPVAATRPDADLGPAGRQGRRRRRGEPSADPPLSLSMDPSRRGKRVRRSTPERTRESTYYQSPRVRHR